jgi:hypothetical protein
MSCASPPRIAAPKVTIFSTLKGLDRRVKNALSPCKQNAMIAKGGHHAKSADQ